MNVKLNCCIVSHWNTEGK